MTFTFTETSSKGLYSQKPMKDGKGLGTPNGHVPQTIVKSEAPE
jgi:hypothetical protein